MSFLIKCNECQNELVVKDKGSYPNTDTIDLLAITNYESGVDTLEVFCKNPDCNNYAMIQI